MADRLDARSIPLRGSRWLTLADDRLTIHDPSGAVITAVALDDISTIRRGGVDIIFTRRVADPFVVSALTVADAQRLLDAVRQRQAARSRTPWWRRHPAT